MAKKKVKKKATKKTTAKKKTAKKTAPKKTPKRKKARKKVPGETKPTATQPGRSSIRPFEVCNHYGFHLREIFEKEHSRNHQVQLGEVFEFLLSDLNGAWNMVKVYGKDMPVEKLRGKSNPFQYDL
jgi:hypothetical protein